MRLEHHLVGGYVRYISPHIIIIITKIVIAHGVMSNHQGWMLLLRQSVEYNIMHGQNPLLLGVLCHGLGYYTPDTCR